jgi:hypothetical protein
MMIRKLTVGNDYKNAMNYVVNQEVLGGKYKINYIQINDIDRSVTVWIINETREVVAWKKFSKDMPISIEYNIEF